MKTAATKNWYGNSGTPPPPFELDVELWVALLVVTVWDCCRVLLPATVEVELLGETALALDELATDVVLGPTAVEVLLAPELPRANSSTLLIPLSATQRFPEESKAMPSGLISRLWVAFQLGPYVVAKSG